MSQVAGPPDSVHGEQVPLLLQESLSVTAVVEVGSQTWLLPGVGGGSPEQAQLVWVGLDPYGEDYEISEVMVAVPGRGLEGSVRVRASSAYGEGLPSVSVRFMQGTRDLIDSLLSLETGTAAAPENTFSPESGGVLWPSASELCRHAPRPQTPPEVLVQFTDLGPQFALQGDAITEGFITGSDEEDSAPLLPIGGGVEPVPGPSVRPSVSRGRASRGRGRGRARSVGLGLGAVDGRATRGTDLLLGASGGVADRVDPSRALIDEIRETVRAEVTTIANRVEALERASTPRPPSASAALPPRPLVAAAPVRSFPPSAPPGLDPVFGRSAAAPVNVESAAREAQRLLGLGASGPGASGNPFAMPRSSPTSHQPAGHGVPPSASQYKNMPIPKVTAAPPLPALPPAPTGGSAVLERIAAALEASAGRPSSSGETDTVGGAGNLSEYLNLLGGAAGADGGAGAGPAGANARVGGLWALERIKRTRRDRPDLVVEAAESIVRGQLGVLPGEAWNYRRHAEQELIPLCGNFSTLKRMVALIAACLDEGRAYGLEQQHAMLLHAYKVLEATARDPAHEMHWAWPVLGISDPAGKRTSNWAPGEAAALVAFHRDEAALEESKRKLAGGPRAFQGHDPASGVSDGGADVPWWKKTAAAKAAAKAAAAAVAKAKAKADPKGGNGSGAASSG